MELEVETCTSAPPQTRDPDRLTHRNGYRERDWETRAGAIGTAPIGGCGEGGCFPGFLEPRRMAEKALTASDPGSLRARHLRAGSVDALVQAMGMSGISKSRVSRLSVEIDDKVQTLL